MSRFRKNLIHNLEGELEILVFCVNYFSSFIENLKIVEVENVISTFICSYRKIQILLIECFVCLVNVKTNSATKIENSDKQTQRMMIIFLIFYLIVAHGKFHGKSNLIVVYSFYFIEIQPIQTLKCYSCSEEQECGSSFSPKSANIKTVKSQGNDTLSSCSVRMTLLFINISYE